MKNTRKKISGPGPAAVETSGGSLVYEEPGTKHRDYILNDYRPVCDPRGRLHSFSLCRAALEASGNWASFSPVLNALRAGLGRDEVVWGIKYGPAGFGFELYFYNNSRNPPGNPKSAARLRKILKPFAPVIRGKVPESVPYFMCSLDLDAASLKAGSLPEFRVYLKLSADEYSGFSYVASDEGLRLENHYRFYTMPRALEQVRERLRLSGRTCGDKTAPKRLLPGYLTGCRTVCYAVKPSCDALYFSRIPTAALERVAAEHGLAPVRRALSAAGDGFAHLLWDVGFDLSPRRGAAEPAVEKIGIYGVL